MRMLCRFAASIDRAALAGPVTSFEEDADLEALVHHPLLEFDEQQSICPSIP
jgi:hypothetical protein